MSAQCYLTIQLLLCLLETRQEQVDICRILHLLKEKANVLQELLRPVVVEQIHIHALGPASCERRAVILLLDKLPDAGQDHGARIDSLKIATGHLKDQTHFGGHGRDESSAALNASAPLIIFRVVLRDD